MKLTWKLSLAVGLGVLGLLSAHAGVRVQRDAARSLEDLRSDHRTLGRALAASVELLAAREGEERARTLVEEVNQREPNIEVRWVLAGEVSASMNTESSARLWRTPGRTESLTAKLPSGDEALITLMTLRAPAGPVSAIEMIERLPDEPWYEREAVTRTAITTAIVIALCIGTILGFGVVFVGRPLNALRDHARRVGRGERAIRTELGSRDEIGELAAEMNAMTRALDDAREHVEAEEQARAVALAQLRHADRLRVVGEIASSVAHDLGTPMAAVRARSQMIGGGEVALARAQELARANMVDVDRMGKSIRHLLDYARRDQPQRELVDIVQWVSATVDLVRPVSERRGVELSVRAREGRASLDAEQMRHVLMNLMTNAIEASPPGSRVVIHAETDARDLRIAVSDAGPGIPPDQLEQVFEPFFTTKPRGEGTGLGLSIARGIVHEQGGQIRAERGTCGTDFIVTVPVSVPGGTGMAPA